MKNNKLEPEDDVGHDLEILKAVAQAWHGHSGSSSTTNEFDARRLNFKRRPTRFKLEVMNRSMATSSSTSMSTSTSREQNWDFGQSLWDSYEIVTLSKRLEAGMVMDHQFSQLGDQNLSHKRPKESKNSLRNLFKMMSSRRFGEAEIPSEEGT